MVVKTYNLSTQEVEMEMGGSKVQGHLNYVLSLMPV